MRRMTLEQLRAANDAGGVSSVILKGRGGGFVVEIATRSGPAAVLTKARSSEPRRFGNPAAALNLLRDLGIAGGSFDIGAWNPDEKEDSAGNRGRADAMRRAHQAAAYNDWLAAEVQASLEDPRPSIPNDEVMAELDAYITTLEAAHKRPRRRKRA